MRIETSDTGKPGGLIRGLGFWAATAVVIGSMVGQAVFLVASDMAREVDSMWKALVVWIAGGVIALFGALCYAELGAAIPEAGGDYVYLGRGLGPLWGFLYGWTASVTMRPAFLAGAAAALLRFVGFLAPWVTTPIFVSSLHFASLSQPYQVTFTPAQPLAAVVVVFVTLLNYLGVRTVGRIQILLTTLKIATIVAILVLGITANPTSDRTAFVESPAHGPIVAFLTALVPVMYAYNGFQQLGPLGGEVLNPRKNIPRAVIVGTSLVIVLYVAINWVYFHQLSISQVAQSLHVASDTVARLLGGSAAKYFTVAMVVSAFGSLHAAFLTGPRVPYAMARDGNFFGFAKRIQPKFLTPSGALVFQGFATVLLVLTGTYEELYSYVIFAISIFLGLSTLALIRLRSTEPDLPRPFRVWGYPWIPLLFGFAALAIAMNLWLVRPVRSSVGLMIILSGIPFFYYWRRRALMSSQRAQVSTLGSNPRANPAKGRTDSLAA